MVRVSDTHLFLAVCEMCVFRYRQHSSRDKPLGPHPFNPHPPQSLHPLCLLKCVCVCSCLRWTGVCVPCTAALSGVSRKDSCVFERNRKRKKERVEGQQACQSRPSLLEWVPQTLLFSVSSLPLSFYTLTSSPFLSLCLIVLPLPPASLLLLFNCCFCCSVLFCSKIFGFTCNAPVAVPWLYLLPIFSLVNVFTFSNQYLLYLLCLCHILIDVLVFTLCPFCPSSFFIQHMPLCVCSVC